MHDLSKYSLVKLQALEVQIVEELKSRHYLSISQAREQILHIAQSAGLSVKDLLSKRAPKSNAGKSAAAGAVAAKYRNPANAAQQWSGRGRQPQWFKDHIASGKSADDIQA